ncbi:MAG: hypothetical protein EBT59_08160 [Betaproteobacteria bacterium]|nr:hypothetical protein [Betaproteobacteria bacterium]
MLPYALTIFLSAFLLFLVQPLIAKQILPWFGGSASVWNTCMLFFQTLLLAGYAYADRSVQHLNAKRQVILHAVLLVLSLLCLPIIASESWKPQGDEDPIIRILGLLVATIGLPYALLSTTTPLIQAWYWQSFKQAVPYRLFALSNAASLAALLGYPTLIEPFFGGRQTALVWSLASLKPHPSQLTRFYLAMSLGGALGALSIAIGAPMLLSGYYELHITLAVIALVLLWRSFDSTWIWRFSSAGLVAAVLFLVHDGLEAYRLGIREMERNFYGVVRTRDYPSEPGFRYMLHGAINHGGQLQGEPFEMMPATYYSPNSGYGRLFQAMPEGPKRVGLIGLGAGALAAYAQSGDQWVIYEINPAVVDLAKKEFSFLDRMKAPYEIVLGDGRLALEREAPRQYDVLAVDAFSGDSIPIHLVTKEAMAAYVKHLAPGGVIVFQATNRFVDLPPVAKRLADAFGLEAVLVEDSPQFTTGPERWYLHTDQIIMTKNKDVLKHPAFKEAKPINLRPDVGVFTDDHSNLLRILKH